MLDLKEFRARSEGVRGQEFPLERKGQVIPKTEKVWEPTMQSFNRARHLQAYSVQEGQPFSNGQKEIQMKTENRRICVQRQC